MIETMRAHIVEYFAIAAVLGLTGCVLWVRFYVIKSEGGGTEEE